MADGLSLGEKISDLRKKFGLTQDEFGEKIDVSRQSVASWEKNVSAPKSDKILDICRAYDVNPNYFYEAEVAATSMDKIDAKCRAGSRFIDMLSGFLYFLIPVVSLSVFVISAILLWSGVGFRASDAGKGLLMAMTVLSAILFVCIVICIIRKIYKILISEN